MKRKDRIRYELINGRHIGTWRGIAMHDVADLKIGVGGQIPRTQYIFVEEKPLEGLLGFKDHWRLRVFNEKGTRCSTPGCSSIGTRFIQGMDRRGAVHWDVYTSDLILMTVDHIMPRSKGGSDDMSNLQPMCTYCNQRKKDTII